MFNKNNEIFLKIPKGMILNNENIPPGLVDLLPDEKELLRECSVRIPKNIFHQFELRIRIVNFVFICPAFL